MYTGRSGLPATGLTAVLGGNAATLFGLRHAPASSADTS
jgi:hypothetical protein